MSVFAEMIHRVTSHGKTLGDVVARQVREEELGELDELLSDVCQLPVAGGSENSYGKVNILLQSFISRNRVDCFSLVSDQAYVAQVRTLSSYIVK